MFSFQFQLKVSHLFTSATRISHYRFLKRSASELRHSYEEEIEEHKKTGRLPLTFVLNDPKHYDKLSQIRKRSDRLTYLRSLMSTIKTPPVFAVPLDAGGVHTGFLTAHRTLRQPDLVDISTWNTLKAQRLGENLLLNCSGIESFPLAQLVIDMKLKMTLLTESWWPILVGLSKEQHDEVIEILKIKHKLDGAFLYAWDTQKDLPDTKDLTLICANRGETIYQINPNENYLVQIDSDAKQCCLGHVDRDTDQIYKNVVKIESRTKSFGYSKPMGTSDLFLILAQLKMKGLFYKRVKKEIDDETHNIKWSPRQGLITKFSMSTLEDLRTAVKQTLEQNGSLAATRAKLRADIFATLQDPTEVKPRIPHENLLLNELILEYLNHNHLHASASVFSVESGQPTPSLGRAFVAEQLNVHEDDKTRSIPLLYSLLSHFSSNAKTAQRVLSNQTD